MKGRNLQKNIIIVIACMLVNIFGKYIGEVCALPLWLDSIGTCVSAYYGNVFVAALVAVCSNVFFGLWNPIAPVYAITGYFLAVAIRFCVKKGYMERISYAVLSSFWLGVISLMISTPINLYFYEGHCGNLWGDALFGMLEWRGVSRFWCALAGEAMIDLVDKQVCVYFAYVIIHGVISRKKDLNIDKKIVTVLLPFVIGVLAILPKNIALASGFDSAENYVGKIFNSSNGMISSEANVIAEMPDGTIWIGSYAGLTRYDGRQTQFITDGGVSSVTAMYVDTKGRMWIGTNDNGIVRYENKVFSFLKTDNGLTVNSIRCFAEAGDGSMFVGTTDKLCRITPEDKIEVLETKYSYVISLAVVDDYLLGVDNKGHLFAMTLDGEEIPVSADLEKEFINCVEVTKRAVVAGTSKSYIYLLQRTKAGIEISRKVNVSIQDIVSIEEGEEGRLWICAEEGFGYIGDYYRFVELHYEGFDAAFEWIHEDYQGNIWLASSRYGVLKLSKSELGDVFSNIGLDAHVVNAVVKYERSLYCGTDSGLVVIDMINEKQRKNKLTEMLEGVRIRSLMVDSHNVLWLCTYSDYGLISYDTEGNITTYNMSENQTTSNRFRCLLEAMDGTIIAGTADGINYIRDGKVIQTVTASDGLMNTQILSLVQDSDGIVYAASDGAGIYLLKEGKIIKNYSTQDGLSSDVILRMIPYQDNFLIVTSNALCLLENGIVQRLKSFPYFNNYDIVIRDEEAFVLSSAGIYRVNNNQLLADEIDGYELFNVNQGLTSGLIANSWNYLDENGTLYFCGNSGVISFKGAPDVKDVPVKYGIAGVYCDGKKIIPRGKVYEIPADTKLISVDAAVMHYALSDIGVRMYVEGTDAATPIRSFQNLESLQIANLNHGDYTLHIQLYGDDNTLIDEMTYVLTKQAQVWEDMGFTIYLSFVIIEVIAFITWNIMLMVSYSRRKEELERRRKELEEQVSIQTAEIRKHQERTNRLFLDTVIALSDAVDAKDRYTSGHSKRVAQVAKLLAIELGKSKEEQEEIYFAGLLHDIGKIRIPKSIINKPGKLTAAEREIINIHPVTGYHILKGISEEPSIALAARFHHERYDGNGYPNGLKGEDIPEIARIIGVADTYDAMASNRSYRRKLPKDVIVEELKRVRGQQLDPVVTDAMLALLARDEHDELGQQDDVTNMILVVTGDAEEADRMRDVIQEEAYNKVLLAYDEKQALDIMSEERVDMVCLDMDIPDMDSFEVFKKMKELQNVAIVFMSAGAGFEKMQQVKELGGNDYLTKPLSATILKEIVYSTCKSLNNQV